MSVDRLNNFCNVSAGNSQATPARDRRSLGINKIEASGFFCAKTLSSASRRFELGSVKQPMIISFSRLRLESNASCPESSRMMPW